MSMQDGAPEALSFFGESSAPARYTIGAAIKIEIDTVAEALGVIGELAEEVEQQQLAPLVRTIASLARRVAGEIEGAAAA